MGMKNRFQEAIQNVQRQRHLARRSVAMVLVLAMLTAMSVSWRLHQDGIALAADDTRYYCGKEEHKHTDDCYIEGTEPICGYEEGEIVEETMDSADDAGDGDSSAADWDEAGSEPESEPATQEEPEPEVVLHHHTADCYEEEEVLTCGIESDHVHQDYCYDQETGELLCTEHEHTDDCYTLEKVLVCGQEEGEPEKTDDGAALYDTDENSAEESDSAEEPETVADPEPEQEATKPETDEEIDTGYTVHHHTDECYGKVLICGKEEHEHTAACLVNPNAEIDAEYDAKTPDRTSVDWAQDMVLVARSQLGYTESKADVDEDGNGYTMYADQYYKDKPMVYADWDSTFVAYCLYHAGVPQDIIPQYASISALRGELARMNSEYYTDDPQEFASILPGDIVMYKNAEGRETIGVVSDAAVDEETDLTTALTVISGDVATGCESDGETTIDQVAEVSVALNEVTSFVSVNAAEGYGVDDLMDDDVAVQDMTDAELQGATTDFSGYITDVKAEDTEFVAGSKEYYKSHITIDFKVSGKDKKNIKPDEYAYRIDLPKNVSLSEDYMDMLLGQEFDIANGTAQEGKVRFVKKKDGTYAILLKFNKEYLENTSEIVGYIQFWGDLNVESTKEDGTIEIPFYNNKKLEIKPEDIKHPDGETYQYDVSVKKDGSYSIKDGKLTYTVNVVSKKGTPDNVEFVDEIAKITLGDLTLGTPEIVVKKRTVTQKRSSKEESWSDGTPSSDWVEDKTATEGLKYDAATGKIEGELPKMTTTVTDNGLSRTYEEYEVTYTYKVSNLDAKEYTVGNDVKVKSSTDVTVTGKDHEDVPIKNTYTIKKENSVTYKNGKAQITWKITANENGLDIAGKTILDEMFVKAMDGINGIKVEPDNGYQFVDSDGEVTTDIGKVAGIQFIGVNGETENRQKYTITYTTEHDITDKSQTITNTAGYSVDATAGYYLFKDTTATGDNEVYITEVVGNVTIKAKNSNVPGFEKKLKDKNDTTDNDFGDWQDVADHDIGDKIPFKLEATVPADYAEYSKYYFAFHDKEETGLTFNRDSVKVYVDDTEIKNDFEVKTTTTTFADGCSFEVVFSDLKTITSVKAGSKIRVEYTSTLNDKAVIGDEGNLNKAQLEYSNNPRDTNSKDKTVWDNVVVFTYQVVVNKYANSVAEDNKLTGAEFTLSKKLKDGTSKVITAVKSEEGTRFTFKGLDDGEYTLTETVTPEGYNTIDPITFNVSADHEITWDGTGNRNDLLNSLTGNEVTGEITFAKNANVNGSLVTDIINKSGTVLPSTGGMGTTVFYVVGGGLMAVAVVLLVTKKRMENKR